MLVPGTGWWRAWSRGRGRTRGRGWRARPTSTPSPASRSAPAGRLQCRAVSEPQVWRVEVDEAETVGRLLAAFRTHNGSDWPSDNAMLATVERLIEQPDVDFLLASVDV